MSATATQNGSARAAGQAPAAAPVTPEDSFPVNSFRAAARHLRRPFAPNAVKFKIQQYGADRRGENVWAMVVAHIDARLVAERLNLVCPHLWSATYEPTNLGMWCQLTIDGITRTDFGSSGAKRDDPMYGKALVSDALKRSAVMFGVGVSLYAVPRIFLKLNDGHIRKAGRGYVFTDAGTIACRRAYERWLESEGGEKFGRPLDHGDAEDAVGDADVPLPPEPEAGTDQSGEAVERCLGFVMEAIERRLVGGRALMMRLLAAGATDSRRFGRALASMQVDAVNGVAQELADLIAAADERGGDDGR